MVEIYILNTKPLNDLNLFEEKLKTLSEFRQKKVLSFKRMSDRVLSLGGGLLIGYGLKELGLYEKNIRYAQSEYGKPYFKDYPNIHFNISHSGNIAVCAFSKYSVGCDVEMLRTPDFNVAEKFFSNSEKKYIFGIENENKSEREREFFKIWTLKESFVKAIGRGLSIPFKEFSVDPCKCKLCGSRIYNENEYYFKEYIFDDYIISCCCEESEFPKTPKFCEKLL